ncbi:uncharacterized protein F54H12.2 [Trichonephila clavipes]|nr:uncharacterized protein F54H12.2 [Trichonephila clavipes]
MIGPLHCDIFQQNCLLLNLVDAKIKMNRTKPDFCLMSTKTREPNKVVLQHASLFIRKVKVNPGVSLGHAKALEKVQRNIQLTECYARLIPYQRAAGPSCKTLCF